MRGRGGDTVLPMRRRGARCRAHSYDVRFTVRRACLRCSPRCARGSAPPIYAAKPARGICLWTARHAAAKTSGAAANLSLAALYKTGNGGGLRRASLILAGGVSATGGACALSAFHIWRGRYSPRVSCFACRVTSPYPGDNAGWRGRPPGRLGACWGSREPCSLPLWVLPCMVCCRCIAAVHFASAAVSSSRLVWRFDFAFLARRIRLISLRRLRTICWRVAPLGVLRCAQCRASTSRQTAPPSLRVLPYFRKDGKVACGACVRRNRCLSTPRFALFSAARVLRAAGVKRGAFQSSRADGLLALHMPACASQACELYQHAERLRRRFSLLRRAWAAERKTARWRYPLGALLLALLPR